MQFSSFDSLLARLAHYTVMRQPVLIKKAPAQGAFINHEKGVT